MGVHGHQPQVVAPLLGHGIIKAQATDRIPHEVPVQQPERPGGRYGDRPTRPRPAVVAVLVVLGALFAAWVVWAGLGAATPEPGADVSAFRVVSDAEIEVRVVATSGSPERFGCSVQALDRTREVVGVASVTLRPARDGREGRWVTVRTRDRAVTATVGRCSAMDRAAGRGQD
jgi:hypothetical protein